MNRLFGFAPLIAICISGCAAKVINSTSKCGASANSKSAWTLYYPRAQPPDRQAIAYCVPVEVSITLSCLETLAVSSTSADVSANVKAEYQGVGVEAGGGKKAGTNMHADPEFVRAQGAMLERCFLPTEVYLSREAAEQYKTVTEKNAADKAAADKAADDKAAAGGQPPGS